MEFWKEESSLYQIIKDHLDQEGYFDPDLIEDQNFGSIIYFGALK